MKVLIWYREVTERSAQDEGASVEKGFPSRETYDPGRAVEG